LSHCIFCDILAGRAPSSVVFADERCHAFLSIHPVNPGHLLVIPNDHAASLAELDPETGAHMFQVAQCLAAALRDSKLRCEGITLSLADGEAAGQEVFHVHLHVIPRVRGDGFGWRLGAVHGIRPSRAELDRVADSIRGAL
jgi:diadenosine tetraphosphate (Ap4A) HIT family hydrolase